MKNGLKYIIGSSVSSFGDGLQQIAMMWLIYQQTGKPVSIAIMIGLYYAPSIVLTPILSVLVDRFNSKSLTILTDAVRFFLVGVISILLLTGDLSTGMLYVLQLILAVCYTIYKPASQSFIKSAFTKQEIASVLGKSSSFSQIATIAGAGTAGFLLASFPATICISINALTFLFPVLFFSLIKVIQSNTPANKGDYFQDLKDGFIYVRTESGLPYLLFLSILNSIAIQMSATMLLPLADSLNGGSALYAAFDIAFTIGGTIAGFGTTFLLKKYNRDIVLYTMTGMIITTLLMSKSNNPWVVGILLFGFGYVTMLHLISTQTMIQLVTKKEYIGRVVGVRTILASCVKITAALLTGVLLESIGIHHILLAFSMIMFGAIFTKSKIRTIAFTME